MRMLKKLMICVVTLSLALSVMVLPIMAEQVDVHDHVETIAPRYNNAPCVYCGGRTEFYGEYTVSGIRYVVTKCVDCGKYIVSDY